MCAAFATVVANVFANAFAKEVVQVCSKTFAKTFATAFANALSKMLAKAFAKAAAIAVVNDLSALVFVLFYFTVCCVFVGFAVAFSCCFCFLPLLKLPPPNPPIPHRGAVLIHIYI